ncbi:hypothetical protein QJS04_geneDACA023114 [Acorus gramineus]|uniref:RNase H type-1 domain-containing protein n=1 Tax=Acorus gramineus TaxID=55184 RepID=A0AAV8ZY40_ACOGR|nr:hypothetical protein QJS04_geneDACA023114 [Acorus gramineus]
MVQHISCSLCKRGQESHDRLFFACSFSCYIWKAIATKLDLRRPPSSPISQWQQWLDNLHLQEGKLKLMQAFLATSIMLIWKERCMRIYQGKERHKNLILKDVFELTQVKLSTLTLKTADPNFSQKFLGELGLQMILLQPQPQGVTWVRPTLEWVVVNSDGFRSEDCAGCGASIQDSLGRYVVGPQLKLGFSRVMFQTDSKIIEAWLKGKGHIPWRSKRVFYEIQDNLSMLDQWPIHHIHREANQPANILASKEQTLGHNLIHPNNVWPSLEEILLKDREGQTYQHTTLM